MKLSILRLFLFIFAAFSFYSGSAEAAGASKNKGSSATGDRSCGPGLIYELGFGSQQCGCIKPSQTNSPCPAGGVNNNSNQEQVSDQANNQNLVDACAIQCKGQTKADRNAQCVAECRQQGEMGPPAPVEFANNTGITNECQAEFQTLVQACEENSTDATQSCNQDENSDMKGVLSQAGSVFSQADQVIRGVGGAMGVPINCSKYNALAGAANVAIAGFSTLCTKAIDKCSNKCTEAKTFLQKNRQTCFPGADATVANEKLLAMLAPANTQINSCNGLRAKIPQAEAAINSVTQSLNGAAQCAQQAAGAPNICAANPTMLGCVNGVVDCTHPSMATNEVCCAQNGTCPKKATTADNTYGGGSTDFSSRLPSTGNTSIGGDDIPGLGEIAQGSKSPGGGRGVDGKVGGGAGIAGGGDSGGGGGSGGSGGGAGEEAGHAVNAGFYGSGGGGSFGSGSAGSGGSQRYGMNSGAGGGGVAGRGGPDLRSFLPGGQYDPRQRGLAGATGVDGITGPHSSLWEKVKNRYQSMSPTLLP